jgi:uncharacterized membrane protein YraQ (UPF0718 family)
MKGKNQKKAYGGWVFLAIVVGVYGLFGMFNLEATIRALNFFIHVMSQVLPVLALVFLLLIVANLVLKPEWIKRYLGKESGIKGWITAVIGGVLSMGPIYTWYTMLRELRQQGMRNALIATFLYSRAVKPPLLPLMIYYFGVTYTLILYLYLIAFSIITGIMVEKLIFEKSK